MTESQPSPVLFDIGVNLYSKQFNNQIDALLQRALEAGVESMIAIASDVSESVLLHQSAPIDVPKIWTTSGVHPHQANTFDENSVEILRRCLSDPRCVAVGECGLDYNRMFSTKAEQKHAFNQQITLAIDLNKPLYLHQRDAHSDFLETLKSHFKNGSVPGVVHCFTENRTTLRAYLDMGLYIGITGWVCDERRGMDLRDALSFIPQDRILLETDAPYLKPRGYSGPYKTKRNEPCLLPFIAKYVARELAVAPSTLIQHATANAHHLFQTKL